MTELNNPHKIITFYARDAKTFIFLTHPRCNKKSLIMNYLNIYNILSIVKYLKLYIDCTTQHNSNTYIHIWFNLNGYDIRILPYKHSLSFNLFDKIFPDLLISFDVTWQGNMTINIGRNMCIIRTLWNNCFNKNNVFANIKSHLQQIELLDESLSENQQESVEHIYRHVLNSFDIYLNNLQLEHPIITQLDINDHIDQFAKQCLVTFQDV